MPSSGAAAISVVVDSAIVGNDALLKTCYWFSRDFHHEINRLSDDSVQVQLLPKKSATADTIARAQEDFLNTAIDFEEASFTPLCLLGAVMRPRKNKPSDRRAPTITT